MSCFISPNLKQHQRRWWTLSNIGKGFQDVLISVVKISLILQNSQQKLLITDLQKPLVMEKLQQLHLVSHLQKHLNLNSLLEWTMTKESMFGVLECYTSYYWQTEWCLLSRITTTTTKKMNGFFKSIEMLMKIVCMSQLKDWNSLMIWWDSNSQRDLLHKTCPHIDTFRWI